MLHLSVHPDKENKIIKAAMTIPRYKLPAFKNDFDFYSILHCSSGHWLSNY